MLQGSGKEKPILRHLKECAAKMGTDEEGVIQYYGRVIGRDYESELRRLLLMEESAGADAEED